MKYFTPIYLFFSSCPAAAVVCCHLENHLRRKSQNNACRVSAEIHILGKKNHSNWTGMVLYYKKMVRPQGLEPWTQ